MPPTKSQRKAGTKRPRLEVQSLAVVRLLSLLRPRPALDRLILSRPLQLVANLSRVLHKFKNCINQF